MGNSASKLPSRTKPLLSRLHNDNESDGLSREQCQTEVFAREEKQIVRHSSQATVSLSSL